MPVDVIEDATGDDCGSIEILVGRELLLRVQPGVSREHLQRVLDAVVRC